MTFQQQQAAPPPGWYTDPHGHGQRWWTGARWTEHAREAETNLDPTGLLIPNRRTYPARALGWGIVAMLLPIAFLPAILAIVFGAFGVASENRLENAGHPSKRKTATVGLVLGCVSLVLMIGVIALATVFAPSSNASCVC